MHTTKYNLFRVVFSSALPRGKEVTKGVLWAQRNHWKVRKEVVSCQYLSVLFLKSQDNILVLKTMVAAHTFASWRATAPHAALAQSTLFCCRMSCPAEVSPSHALCDWAFSFWVGGPFIFRGGFWAERMWQCTRCCYMLLHAYLFASPQLNLQVLRRSKRRGKIH